MGTSQSLSKEQEESLKKEVCLIIAGSNLVGIGVRVALWINLQLEVTIFEQVNYCILCCIAAFYFQRFQSNIKTADPKTRELHLLTIRLVSASQLMALLGHNWILFQLGFFLWMIEGGYNASLDRELGWNSGVTFILWIADFVWSMFFDTSPVNWFNRVGYALLLLQDVMAPKNVELLFNGIVHLIGICSGNMVWPMVATFILKYADELGARPV
jgi:hypothetical protein